VSKGNKPTANAPDETPLMRQYAEMKAKYPDAILLFRVGDFYETFGADAVAASKALGITLTSRNNGGSDVELAGFPFHALDNYLPKLVRGGFRVAICEQLEKPSPQKKIVKRGVTELVTPGVTANDQLLEHKKNNYLCSLHSNSKGVYGIALTDLSTGEFLASEGDQTYIDKLLQSFNPAEIIFSKGRAKEFNNIIGGKYYTYPIDDWVYSLDFGREKLLQHFQVPTLKGYGVEELELAQVAGGAILHYLATTENKHLQHLTRINRIESDRYVWLDRFTIRNLELLYAQYESGTPLIHILDQTISPMGARLMRKWVGLPLKDRVAVENRLSVVEFLILHTEFREGLRRYIYTIGDMERLIAKVPLKKITPREVLQLHKALSAIEPIKHLLDGCGAPSLMQMGERLNVCALIRDEIARRLTAEPPAALAKGDVIAKGVSPELDELRDLIYNSKDHLLRIQQDEIVRTGINSLKVGFNNVFGYYIEVTAKYKDVKVPEHWVRKQTLANAERYITEDLKVLETKILNAEERILLLEEQLFDSLISEIADYIAPIQTNANVVARLDCLLAFAQVALKYNYCKPQILDTLELSIKDGRHPVIEQQLPPDKPYVPNDIYLHNDDQQIMMITGPNMSGKSAVLRQTALIVLMAQMGSFVPATKASIGLIDKVFTRVGASDNISGGESTFMVEMNETAGIMNNISERSLILLDEIGRGTSTYDGISIAWSIAEYLHDNAIAQPKTLFATHYHELNELAGKFPRIHNYNVAVREAGQRIIFLRKLQAGGSEHSFGIHVAEMAGMPKAIVQRAEELLRHLEQKTMAEEKEEEGSTPKQKLRKTQRVNYQLNVFEAADPRIARLRELLENLDINTLSPIEALLKLNELKKLT
jgi:DNA mismatch repair protein MutS